MDPTITRRSLVGGSALLAAMLSMPRGALASSGLDGYDISGQQGYIDTASVPADFVIVKATEGTTYTSAYLTAQAQGVLGSGKLLGLYHYARGNTVAHEVSNFLAAAGPYLGQAALFLDWEGYGNSLFGSGDDAAWIAEFCAEVKAQTGVTPLVYASASVAFGLGVDDAHLWVAQYASSAPVYGYEASPWNEGSYSCAVRQYASTGRLDGYGGDLDMDRFYGSRADWLALCEGATITYLTEDKMEFICNYNKEGRMVWFDGTKLHWLDEPDTMTSVQMAYQLCEQAKSARPGEIPVFDFGEEGAPWASRFAEAVYDGSEELDKFYADHPRDL
jgi:GH25 family lysozyme M1 (1,4-beta-N-acetylmuramidase)